MIYIFLYFCCTCVRRWLEKIIIVSHSLNNNFTSKDLTILLSSLCMNHCRGGAVCDVRNVGRVLLRIYYILRYKLLPGKKPVEYYKMYRCTPYSRLKIRKEIAK